MDPLDAFLADLDPDDRSLLGDLVAEETEARGVRDPAAPDAAPVVAQVLRELAERLAVELDAERDPPPDDGWDDDPDWDAPAVPYDNAELGRIASASIDPTPIFDLSLGRFLESLPNRRRKGVMKRAKRQWEAAGVRDPDDPASRDAVRAAIVSEALQEGFEPPARTVDVPTAGDDGDAADAERLVARLPLPDQDAAAAIHEAHARLGPAAVRETLDQAAFLALRGGLRRDVRGRWVAAALRSRRA